MTAVRVEDRLREMAQRAPDRTAIIGIRSRCTYGELDRLADQAATDMARRGIGPGDRVAWLGVNDIAYVVTALAVRRRGACLAGLNWREPTENLRSACGLVGPALLVADPGNAVTARELAAAAGDVIIAGGDALPWRDIEPDPADVLSAADGSDCLVYFTSGATGRPKAVRHSYGRVNGILAGTMQPGFDEDAVLLVIPPVFHIAGATWVAQSLLAGATTVFADGTSTILELIAATSVTHALMVPTLIQMVLDEQDRTGVATPSLRLIAYGTSPISSTLLTRAMSRLGCDFVQMYGSTEAGGAITTLPGGDHDIDGPHRGRLRSAGRPVPGVTIRVVDPGSGHELPNGETGELVVRTPWVMEGYWRDAAETAKVIDAHGWLHTHDAARLDADGYVYLSGRLDDVIISGGENVHPAEVEEVLATLPSLAAAVVVGIPDRRWGEMVAAVVVGTGSPALTEHQVIDFCRGRLAGYKCPRRVVFADDLPRNATGKIIRRRVRDLLITEAARKRQEG
jgi:acyl-CoA synthetase (AMP-forming)/AMP-acid ligase II